MKIGRLLLLVLGGWVLGGCVHLPGHCTPGAGATARKAALLQGAQTNDPQSAFREVVLRGATRDFRCFTPRTKISSAGRPPILLLPEMPALSPGVLELAQRLSRDGFTVYVPLLFGSEKDDIESTWLGLQRAVEFSLFRPAWKANCPRSERQIVAEVAGLCRSVGVRHTGERLGVIGLCLTGIFPVALAGEPQEIPNLHAGVVSQPSIPLVLLTTARRQATGLTAERLQRAAARLQQQHWSVLGFRFAGDEVSPPERFRTLRRELGTGFIDATIPLREYVDACHCPADAHAVLTDGYGNEQTAVHASGLAAYEKMRAYLRRQLRP